MSLRVAFAGTPEFAVPPLAALVGSAHAVVGVLTQPDRPAGRSGCVSTPTTACALPTSAASGGTANSGVPAKATRNDMAGGDR